MATDAIGLYLHIPFCVRKCNYCDFCSFNLASVDWRDEYIDRLCEEISSYKGENVTLNSIFFGGGTPSLLTHLEFDRICEEIRNSFTILPDCEFTVEANPKTLNETNLSSFKKNGVNRLSIGLQSIHENELKILGRIHSYEDFLVSFNLARKFGIDNINVDLMYAIPEQTKDSFAQTLDKILALNPEHISLYGLILEEGTPFYEWRHKLSLPGEDCECDMYYLAAERLREAGYLHYEISNYAREGRLCRHNLKYWHAEEYIGIGLNAYSFFKGIRFDNSEEIDVYLADKGIKYNCQPPLSQSDMAYEYVMLRLRLAEGFSLSDYKRRFSSDFLDGREVLINRLIKAGYLHLDGDIIRLSESGFYISNSILTELI